MEACKSNPFDPSQYPRIDMKELDRQIKDIMMETIPVVKLHMDDVCSPQLLAYIRCVVCGMSFKSLHHFKGLGTLCGLKCLYSQTTLVLLLLLLVSRYARQAIIAPTSIFEDSKILSDIRSDSQLKVVGHTQKLSAMLVQKTKKRHFILTPLDFLKTHQISAT